MQRMSAFHRLNVGDFVALGNSRVEALAFLGFFAGRWNHVFSSLRLAFFFASFWFDRFVHHRRHFGTSSSVFFFLKPGHTN